MLAISPLSFRQKYIPRGRLGGKGKCILMFWIFCCFSSIEQSQYWARFWIFEPYCPFYQLHSWEMNDFGPVQMWEVTAGPANSGSINDRSHLSAGKFDYQGKRTLIDDYCRKKMIIRSINDRSHLREWRGIRSETMISEKITLINDYRRKKMIRRSTINDRSHLSGEYDQ